MADTVLRDRRKRFYDLHSWSGFALGLFVYFVVFTGSVALFDNEIKAWEDTAARLHVVEKPVDFHPLLENFVSETAADGELLAVFAYFPAPDTPYYSAFTRVRPAEGPVEEMTRRWNPATGEVLPERGEGLSRWLLDIHRDLMWPTALGGTTAGRTLVGIAGIVLMLSVLTGVILHAKMAKELFTLRVDRSVRLKWQDLHKVIGVWGLPFHAMIAFTGAFLGVIAILAPIVAVIAFKGDTEALISAVAGGPREPAGVAAPMVPIDEVATLRHELTQTPPSFVLVSNWGDAAATYDVYFDADRTLSIYEGRSVSAVSGEPVANPNLDDASPSEAVTNAIAPLHYGTYGGLALKFVYLALGLALSAIVATGLMMWLERRLHGGEGVRSAAFYRALSRISAGATAGLPLATAALFVFDRLYFGSPEGRLAAIGSTYFGVLSAAIVWSVLQRNEYQTVRRLLAATGLALLLAPLANMATTGVDHWAAALTPGHAGARAALAADAVLAALGVLTVVGSSRLPRERVEKKRSIAAGAPTLAE